jgi:hypothetical protein
MAVDASRQLVIKLSGDCLTLANVYGSPELRVENAARKEIWPADRRTSIQSELTDALVVFATAIAYATSAAIMLRCIGWLLGIL